MKLIEILDATKAFGNQKVLDSMSMHIEKEEFLTILGPSGCGKSTLLRCIAGLEVFDTGEIQMEDKDLSKIRPSDRGIGMIFQQSSLFPTMNVYDNIAFGLSVKGVDKYKIEEKVNAAISMVELNESKIKYPSQLSGGEKQRVSIARTLVTDPKVLLLDEPFSAIDAKLRKQLQYKLREIHEELGITSVFVTHDQNEAMILSDRICIMNKGKIVQSGSPSDIYTNPSEEFVASFIGNYNILNQKEAHKLSLGMDNVESVAIRPETVKIHSQDSELKSDYLKGKIVNLRFQTGLIIYEIEVEDRILTVEKLFSKDSVHNTGDTVYIEIDKSKVIKFSNN